MKKTIKDKERDIKMFEIIVIIYCLVGIFLNVLLIPRKNKLIYEQNQYILERYKHMEKVLNDLEGIISEREGY